MSRVMNWNWYLRLFSNQFDINWQNMFTKANQSAKILSYDDTFYLISSYSASDIKNGEKKYIDNLTQETV